MRDRMILKAGNIASALLAIVSVAIALLVPLQMAAGLSVCALGILLYYFRRESYLAIAVATLAGLYGIGVIPVIVFCATIVLVTIGELIFAIRGPAPISYLYYILAGTLGVLLVMRALGDDALLPLLFGIVVAALLKAILISRDESAFRPIIEAIGISMTIYLIEDLNYNAEPTLIVAAVIIAFAFGYLAYRFRAADLSGAFSGALVGIILIVFADPRWFLIMLLFFILGSGATRYKYNYKLKIGVEQSGGGARGYQNIFANGIVAAAAAVMYGITVQPIFAALYVGAVATAAADTMASEIGVMAGEPYLITTFQRVHAGTNGGVTLAGELVALIGSFVISMCAVILGVIDPTTAVITTIAGFVGTNLDSLFGALLENRGFIGNAGTNLLATLGGGLFAALALLAFL